MIVVEQVRVKRIKDSGREREGERESARERVSGSMRRRKRESKIRLENESIKIAADNQFDVCNIYIQDKDKELFCRAAPNPF